MVCASGWNKPFGPNWHIKSKANNERTLDQFQQVSGGWRLTAGEIIDFWTYVLLEDTMDDLASSAYKVGDLDSGIHQQPGAELTGPGLFHWLIDRISAVSQDVGRADDDLGVMWNKALLADSAVNEPCLDQGSMPLLIRC